MKVITFSLLVLSLFFKSYAGTIKLNDNDWPRFFFGGISEQKVSKGIGKEILDICLPRTGYQFEFTFHPIKRMRKYMEEGKLDINVYSYRPSRESFLLFGKEPIFSASYRPVVLSGSNVKINSIDDFEAYNLGHLLGLRYSPEFYDYVMRRQQDNRLATTTRSSYIIDMLVDKKIDVFVGISASSLWHAKNAGIADKIRILNFDVKTSDYFVTISKKSAVIKDKPLFLSQVDTCLRELKQNGQYKQITDKYRF